MQTLISDGPAALRISALWVEDRPERVEHVGADEFLAQIRGAGLGTKTTYVVKAAV
jgi:hypothetical protein